MASYTYKKATFFLQSLRDIVSLPKVTINLWGNDNCYQFYQDFTKRHPSYRIIQNKSMGAALISLPETFEDFLSGKHRQVIRTNRNRAIKKGYRFAKTSPLKHIEEIIMINASMKVRHDKPMPNSYLRIDELRYFFKDYPVIHGIYDDGGTLKAYSANNLCDEVCIINRLLGHGDDLEEGIMYLLISEAVRELINNKQMDGNPAWLMYDTYFGCPPGLRYFKERLGFKPYNVDWQWVQK